MEAYLGDMYSLTSRLMILRTFSQLHHEAISESIDITFHTGLLWSEGV